MLLLHSHSRSTTTVQMVMCKADLHLFSFFSLITLQVILQSLPHCLCAVQVQNTPFCIISALMRQLGAVPAAWGQDTNKVLPPCLNGMQLRSAPATATSWDLYNTCAASAHLVWLEHTRTCLQLGQALQLLYMCCGKHL